MLCFFSVCSACLSALLQILVQVSCEECLPRSVGKREELENEKFRRCTTVHIKVLELDIFNVVCHRKKAMDETARDGMLLFFIMEFFFQDANSHIVFVSSSSSSSKSLWKRKATRICDILKRKAGEPRWAVWRIRCCDNSVRASGGLNNILFVDWKAERRRCLPRKGRRVIRRRRCGKVVFDGVDFKVAALCHLGAVDEARFHQFPEAAFVIKHDRSIVGRSWSLGHCNVFRAMPWSVGRERVNVYVRQLALVALKPS